MLQRKSLQIRELAQRQRAAAARVDHAGSRSGDAAGELVGVLLGGEVVSFSGKNVVVRPGGGDVGKGGEESGVGF